MHRVKISRWGGFYEGAGYIGVVEAGLVPERVGSGQGRGLGWARAEQDRGRRRGRPMGRVR